MVHYKVIISPSALAEIEDAYLWLSEEMPGYADQWLNGLLSAKDSLSNFPKRCPIDHELNYKEIEIRKLLYGKGRGQYKIFFSISNSDVYVLHVRHAARKTLTDL